MLIGITGHAGSGKTTAAKYLVQEKSYICVPFAAPLKKMLRGLGLTDRETDGDLKEQPSDILMGVTPRFAMQRLGTEWGRNLIHPDLWIELWRREAERLIAGGHGVVSDDCRFPNEADVLRKLGGKIIGLRTDEALDPAVVSHASETQSIEPDVKILNSKVSFDDFYARINGALEHLGEPHAR
jgi:hypothetical protein